DPAPPATAASMISTSGETLEKVSNRISRPAASDPAVHHEKTSSSSSGVPSGVISRVGGEAFGEASCAATRIPGITAAVANTALPAANCRRVTLRDRNVRILVSFDIDETTCQRHYLRRSAK